MQQTSGHITWLTYQQRLGDPCWQTQINGRDVSNSNIRQEYSPIRRSIDRSIYQFINWWMKWTEGHISRKSDSSTHFTTDLSTETWRRLSTDTNRQAGPQSIDISRDGKNGWRETSVGQQTEVRIYRPIHQRRCGGRIYLSIRQRSAVYQDSMH